jgi:hypothetical protein
MSFPAQCFAIAMNIMDELSFYCNLISGKDPYCDFQLFQTSSYRGSSNMQPEITHTHTNTMPLIQQEDNNGIIPFLFTDTGSQVS